MKRRIICIMILVVWILAVCTAFSLKIEDEMAPQVVMVTPDNSQNLPIDTLFWDDNGMHLYSVQNGNGWETRTLVQETQQENYKIIEKSQKVYTEEGWANWYVQYATKTPVVGLPVKANIATEQGADTWLLYNTQGIVLPQTLPDDINVIQETDIAVLLSVDKASTPFMEDQARSMVYKNDPEFAGMIPDVGNRLFSLTEVKDFMGQLPLLAALFGLILFTLVLWGISFCLVKELHENRRLLIFNAAFGVVLFAGVVILLQVIHLPSSLLPAEVILDVNHYTTEFTTLFHYLQSFSAQGNAEALAVIEVTYNKFLSALVIISFLVTLSLLTVVGEIIIKHRMNIADSKDVNLDFSWNVMRIPTDSKAPSHKKKKSSNQDGQKRGKHQPRHY